MVSYCARTNQVRGSTGSGNKLKILHTEWDAAKVVLRAQVGNDWHVGAPKGRTARMALFTAEQAKFDKPLIGQFSSLKVASQKKNLGAHVKAEEKTVTSSKKTTATKVDATPTIEELKAMLVELQAQLAKQD